MSVLARIAKKSVLALALMLLLTGLLRYPAIAEPPSGAAIFETHCAGCHINGGNIVRRGKNLKLKMLQKQGLGSVEAIAQLVTQGKGIMSAYGDRLSAAEVAAVAAYVREQAKQGWK